MDLTSQWCDNIECELDQLFLFAEHISKNWGQMITGDWDTGRVIHELSICVRNSMFMLDPEKMGTFMEYIEPS